MYIIYIYICILYIYIYIYTYICIYEYENSYCCERLLQLDVILTRPI